MTRKGDTARLGTPDAQRRPSGRLLARWNTIPPEWFGLHRRSHQEDEEREGKRSTTLRIEVAPESRRADTSPNVWPWAVLALLGGAAVALLLWGAGVVQPPAQHVASSQVVVPVRSAAPALTSVPAAAPSPPSSTMQQTEPPPPSAPLQAEPSSPQPAPTPPLTPSAEPTILPSPSAAPAVPTLGSRGWRLFD